MVNVTGVTLNEDAVELTAAGQTVTLEATVAPVDATNKAVTWKSSNPAVATVEGGTVTAVANGTATITVTTVDGGKTDTCAVTVNIPPAVVNVTGVTLNTTEVELNAVGETATLVATVAPADATNKAVTWKSSNPAVATVENGVVTAKANGTATITVTTVDGGKKATCAVTVDIPPVVVDVTGVTLNKTEVKLTAAGQTATLAATVAPANATNKAVTWESSNPAVATVANGVVTAKANGTATITVTTVDGGKTATCDVTVDIPVAVTGVTLNTNAVELDAAGETATLVATVAPDNAANKAVTWRSSNTAVATVANGVVTAKANGTATITVTTVDGGKTATCTVTVNIPVAVRNVTLNKAAVELTTAGETATLVATVAPANAANKAVTWASSNPAVATVENGVVTAVANGVATITVTTVDGGKTAACAVTVNIPVPVTGVSLDKTEVELVAAGETATLAATVAPADATNKAVTWASSNPAVATVENGVVTAVANGTATITVTTVDGGKTATCAVTVDIPPVDVTGVSLNRDTLTVREGRTSTLLTATVAPANATNKNVTWASEDETIATVDQNGKVTGVAIGTTRIVVTTEDGAYTAACTVNVTKASSSGYGIASSERDHSITVNSKVENAKVTVDKDKAKEGETCIIKVEPKDGYYPSAVIVTDKNGDKVTATRVSLDKWEMTMPAGKVSIDVEMADLEVVLQIANKDVEVNDVVMKNDVAPFINESRTMVPIRVIIESLGGTAEWDEATRTVTLTIDGKVLKMTIDQVIAGFDAPAVIHDSRTFVPIRYVAEAVGANVDWIAETQHIVVVK